MKTIIAQLIDDFHERKQPTLVARNKKFVQIPGKANVVIGMRRAGKTFFCYQRMQELVADGIPIVQMLYINFEDDRLLGFTIQDFQTILDIYYRKYPEHRDIQCHFFFDEIQRIAQWELFIRRLLDTENVQVYLTGSSSKLLSTEIATQLRGRSLTTEIFPFSFAEFLKYHRLFDKPPTRLGARTISVLRKAVRDYFEIGGFPEVQTLARDVRIEILQGYIDSVLLKDVIERHKVNNITAIKYLVRHIMNSPGSRFSVNKFYNGLKTMSVKCTKNSLYEYLDHLIDAYLFYRVPIHSRSEKSRILNPAKIYTIDTGLLNAMRFRNSSNYGALLEHQVFMQLRRHGYIIEYVNTQAGYETDFFARHKISNEIKLIQVCWDMSDEKTFQRELRGLQTVMQALSITAGTIVTYDDEASLDNNITVVPIWKWLLS
ncbi:MAG: ATP-binding protein [Candidatus Parabeggiatoa sp. nov. 1]|nr:MAG: ATP-binding protein [Gammaproteobacteria bacterium]